MSITVYHLENSRSLRILWLLEELKLPYDLKKYDRTAEKLAPVELKQAHPLGKAPVITIRDETTGKTITLAESGAIVEYIVKRFGKDSGLGPAENNDEELASYLYYLHYAEGSAMLPLMLHMIFSNMPKRAPILVRPLVSMISNGALSSFIAPRLKQNFGFLESQLKAAPSNYFLGGRLTAADILLSFPIDACPDLDNYPTLKAWLAKIKARPAYRAAEEKGGRIDFVVLKS